MSRVEARRGRGFIVKEFFSRAAKALSVYLDPYGESELKKMELADPKPELHKTFKKADEFGDLIHEQTMQMLATTHERGHYSASDLEHADAEFKKALQNLKKPKPKSNTVVLPPEDIPPVEAAPVVLTPAQRASQIATVIAKGIRGKVNAPRTARFKKQAKAR